MTQTVINVNKEKIQHEIISSLVSTDYQYNLVIAATGVGKTRIAIEYAKHILSNGGSKILIVVPTIQLRDTDWIDELRKWGIYDNCITTNFRIECYASIHKIKNETFDLVIFDEIHRTTEFNSSIFENNTIKHGLGLTATYPKDSVKQYILKTYNFNITANIDLDEAVERGLISPYEIRIIPVHLDSVKKNVLAGSKYSKFLTTEENNYKYLTGVIDRMALQLKNAMFRSPNEVKRLQFLRLARARFLANLNSKLEVAQHVLKTEVNQKTERTLIFCNSIDSARAMCPHTYHSKLEKKKKNVDLDKFRNGEINTLSCVHGLNEGVNISEVDNAIILQVNTSDLLLIQRIGRTLRLKGDGSMSKIFILCAIDTVDEDWVNSVTKNLNIVSE